MRSSPRYKLGRPYVVAGRTYVPRHDENYDRVGTAAYYADKFHGRQTANGEVHDASRLTGAHKTLPLPSYVRVTNLRNRRSLIVRINDRGPFVPGRIVDVSRRAAKELGFLGNGVARVRVQYVGPAPL
ncbi:MAG: septal ring lytic transglycosylase RlpA family protein [Hyphomicrobiaceae bacterium]